MSEISWRFPKLDNGAEQGINDGGIATFKGSELYSNLAREICQNSLDAKQEGEDKVVVEFKIEKLKKTDYPSLIGLDSIFVECKEYWKNRMDAKLERFIKEAEDKLNSDYIDMLVVSDYNTTGLSGAKAEKHEKSKWRALTHSNGVTEKGQGSAGSHGIGKTAPFACSSFRTVFYNSYAKEDEIKAFQGVARLISHTHNGEDTQGIGFYQNSSNSTPIFDDDPCAFRDKLNRKKYGTDVVIAGFKSTPTWNEDIEKAVLSNFFVAIYRGTLVVRVEGITIDKSNLKARIEYYAKKENESGSKDKKINTILEFYYALSEPDEVVNGNILEKDDVELFIKVNDKYSKSIAEMRSIGMVIRSRHRNIFTRYAAVMIVKDGKLNNLLKETEPPAHDKWDPGILEDDEVEMKKAQNARSKLIRWVNDTIAEKCKIEITDELDLDGVSAYLPFDEDDKSLGLDTDSVDTPDSESQFEEPKKEKHNVRKVTLTAKKVKGKKDDNFEPHNGSHGGSGSGSGGTEDPQGDDNVSAPKSGNRSVNMPQVAHQRVVQMPLESIYRIGFILDNNCKKVNIALRALGDDGKKEKVKIINYKFDNKKTVVNSEQISLRDIKAKTLNELFVKLEHPEKMTLELLIY
ncbi:MAG: hypothetical protein J1E85_04485 [Ruminococcus sp.]|nr:hypothetical protein [Ruminococcus sp.]